MRLAFFNNRQQAALMRDREDGVGLFLQESQSIKCYIDIDRRQLCIAECHTAKRKRHTKRRHYSIEETGR